MFVLFSNLGSQQEEVNFQQGLKDDDLENERI